MSCHIDSDFVETNCLVILPQILLRHIIFSREEENITLNKVWSKKETNCDFLRKKWFYHNSLKFQHFVFVKCLVGMGSNLALDNLNQQSGSQNDETICLFRTWVNGWNPELLIIKQDCLTKYFTNYMGWDDHFRTLLSMYSEMLKTNLIVYENYF